jgi:hypothetical protein
MINSKRKPQLTARRSAANVNSNSNGAGGLDFSKSIKLPMLGNDHLMPKKSVQYKNSEEIKLEDVVLKDS